MRSAPFAVALLAGAAIRLAALGWPGTLDVTVWKIWSVNAVTQGPTSLYGVGGSPPEHRLLSFAGKNTTVDYPPLVLYELALVGHLYRAWVDPAMLDGPRLTAAVKGAVFAADLGVTAIIYVFARRLARRSAAQWAALAYWLNPAVVLDGAVLGYLDALFLLPLAGAFLALARARYEIAGGALAAAILTKAQAGLVVPALALVLWNAGGRVACGRALFGAGVVGAAVLGPIAIRGALPNLIHALSGLLRHDMLSAQAANVWWIATWLERARHLVDTVGFPQAYFLPVQRILAISTWIEQGWPNPRPLAAIAVGGVWGWTLWRARASALASDAAAVAALLVHAYFVLAVQVHENHLAAALPLLALASVEHCSLRLVLVALSAIVALNLHLFYGFGGGAAWGLPRTLTAIDLSVLLAAANVVALPWHARCTMRAVERREGGPERSALRTESPADRGKAQDSGKT